MKKISPCVKCLTWLWRKYISDKDIFAYKIIYWKRIFISEPYEYKIYSWRCTLYNVLDCEHTDIEILLFKNLGIVFFLKCIILVSFLWILSLFLFFWREPFSNQLFHPGNYWTKVTVEAIKLCIDQSSPFDACNCTRTCQSDAGKKIACAISVYDTHCLGYWNKENERKNENIQFIVDHFSLTFVNLLLAWNCTSMYDFRIRENFKLGVNTIIGLAYINLFVLEPANS